MRNLMKRVVVAVLSFVTLPTWAVSFSATLPDAIGPMRGVGGPLSHVIDTIDSPGSPPTERPSLRSI